MDINWDILQKVYDEEGISTRELSKRFGISDMRLYRATKKGLFKTRNNKDDVSKIRSEKGKLRKHSDETKQKISKIRKEYLLNNPDKVPYLLNHSRNESYPEKYFSDIFEKENLNIVKYYQVGIYEIDFAIIEKRIAIEIDGEQHYLDSKIASSDVRKNNYLKSLNWDIIRIRWSEYQSLDSLSKKDYIDKIILYIKGLIKDKPSFEIIKNKNYCECGKVIDKRSKKCRSCFTNKNENVYIKRFENM